VRERCNAGIFNNAAHIVGVTARLVIVAIVVIAVLTTNNVTWLHCTQYALPHAMR